MVGLTESNGAQCKCCGRAIKRLCRECLINSMGQSVKETVIDSLRVAIYDHGPITKEWIGSTAKRITSRLRDCARQLTPRDTSSPGDTT